MKRIHHIQLKIGDRLYEQLQQAADAHCSPLAREIRQRLLDSFNSSDNDETVSVPEAGKKYFGLGRNASYQAAARGEIPTIQIGKKLRVPTRSIRERMRNGGAGWTPKPLERK